MATSKNLIPAQRRQRILEYLQVHRSVRSTVLRDLLDASDATIRRDLEWLEQRGLVVRSHGGATLIQRMQQEAFYNTSEQIHPREKALIGQAAAGLIEDNETVFLNNGTTATEVMLALVQRKELQGITIFTNNVSAVLAAQDAPFHVILLGGAFRPRSNSLVGRFATETLRQVYAHKVILGVDGVGLKHGCTSPISLEAEIGRLMIDRCLGPTLVVADHSKWGVIAQYQVARMDQVDMLISDSGFPPESRNALENTGVELRIADAD